jgi:glycopeptide antibiotics resistance protein
MLHLGWFIIYIMYVGTIVLLFGNLVSFVIEYLSKKYFSHLNSLYILLHGVFGGLALGVPFNNMEAA